MGKEKVILRCGIVSSGSSGIRWTDRNDDIFHALFKPPDPSTKQTTRNNNRASISILLKTKTRSLVSRCVTRQLTPFLQTAVPYSTAYCTSHEFLHSCTRHKARVSKYSYQTNKQKTRLLKEVNIHPLLAEVVDEKERKNRPTWYSQFLLIRL